jgi:hypothetical protein
MRRLWHDILLPWLASLLVALAILAVAWLLWPALGQEQRPVPAGLAGAPPHQGGRP